MAKQKKKAVKPKKAKPAKKAKAASKPKPARKKKPALKKKSAPAKAKRPAAAKAKKAPIKKSSAKKPAPKKPAPKAKAAKPAKPIKPAKPVKLSKAALKAAAKRVPPKPAPPPPPDRPTGMYDGVLLCANPKPFPKVSAYSKDELTTLKKALHDERESLKRELASMEGMSKGLMEGEKESGFSTHMAEYAADMQQTETMLGVRSLEEDRLHEVEDAIQRIDTSTVTYGLCLACGSKIGIQRLVAKPFAHLCMDCRKIYERKRLS